MHDQNRTNANILLGALCSASRAACLQAHTLVCRAGVCEEEDFVAHAFGFPLQDKNPGNGGAMGALQLAIDWLSSVFESKSDTSLEGEEQIVGAGGETGDPNSSLTAALTASDRDILLAHLRFRRAMLSASTLLDKPAAKSMDVALKHLAAAKSELDNLRKLCPPEPGASSPAGVKPKEEGPLPDLTGFDSMVNQRLLAPTPPRNIKILSWGDTLACFESLVSSLSAAISITKCTSLQAVIVELGEFGKKEASIVARSHLAELIIQRDTFLCRAPWNLVLRESLWISAEAMSESDEFAEFLEHVLELTQMYLRSLCASKARQRRKLRHLITHWGNLHQEAEELEAMDFLKAHLEASGKVWSDTWWGPQMFTSWVQNHIMRMQIKHLVQGFELDLYSPREYLMIYWYLEYVLSSLIDNLEQGYASLTKGLAATTTAAEASKAITAKKKKKKGKKTGGEGGEPSSDAPAPTAAVSPIQAQLRAELMMVEAQRAVCRGLVRLLAGLSLEGHLHIPSSAPQEPVDAKDKWKADGQQLPFNSLAQIFDQRFQCFQMSPYPPPLEYTDYASSMDTSSYKAPMLFKFALECFMQAKMYGKQMSEESNAYLSQGQLSELQSISRVAMCNQVGLQVLMKAEDKSNLNVKIEFGANRGLATLSVKRK
ncbi:hypothetical protein CYMTET_12354 [Cymbomonas tetramitiformis]|uniref:NAA35-like TPR repeats domain-containing protein n=1 Tax=Cymbomonas tetramitiformis TaxID=36881 RepID=A0AAE0GKN6_9CHLO|nr:hypothetical protein CYMTET_12354 [Cymbomonas tetramitiformis]